MFFNLLRALKSELVSSLSVNETKKSSHKMKKVPLLLQIFDVLGVQHNESKNSIVTDTVVMRP